MSIADLAEKVWKQAITSQRLLEGVSPKLGAIRAPTREINIPFGWAFALQSLGRNLYPAPDLVLRKPIFLCVFFSRGVFFHRHRYELLLAFPMSPLLEFCEDPLGQSFRNPPSTHCRRLKHHKAHFNLLEAAIREQKFPLHDACMLSCSIYEQVYMSVYQVM